MSSPLDQREWKSKINEARRIDDEILYEQLDKLEANHEQLAGVLRMCYLPYPPKNSVLILASFNSCRPARNPHEGP